MQLTDVLAQMGGLQSMARELGVSESEAAVGAEALLPAILGGFKKQAQAQPAGLEGLGGLLGQLGGGGLLDNVLSPQPTDVSLGDDVLGSIFGSRDVSRTVFRLLALFGATAVFLWLFLRQADLGGANLGGANLSGADLQRATLVNADLTGADITACRIYDIAYSRTLGKFGKAMGLHDFRRPAPNPMTDLTAISAREKSLSSPVFRSEQCGVASPMRRCARQPPLWRSATRLYRFGEIVMSLASIERDMLYLCRFGEPTRQSCL